MPRLGKELLYLSKEQVVDCGVQMPEVVNALATMFASKAHVQNPPKPGVYPGGPGSFIHAMPAYVPSSHAVGCKWIAGYPENQQRGLPYINGLMVLNDPATGLPLAVMDAGWITAVRTGAATGLAARFFARENSESVGLVACGVQGRVNLEALVTQLPLLTHVTCYDPVLGVAERFVDEMGPLIEQRYPGRALEFQVVSDVRQAVSEQNCIVSSGPWAPGVADADKPIKHGWVSPGTFVSAVDMDAAWQGQALADANRLVTDDRAQWNYFVSKDVFTAYPLPTCELSDLCDVGQDSAAGTLRRQRDDEVCVAVCMGIAAEDVATSKLVFDAAVERGIGQCLPL